MCPECRLRPISYEVTTPTGKKFRRCYYCKSGFENFVPGCTYKRVTGSGPASPAQQRSRSIKKRSGARRAVGGSGRR